MLHRIGLRNSNKISANQDMITEPNELSKFIKVTKKKGWFFISIDELIDELKFGRIPKKTIVLTFDDGYRDNYSDAFPLLKTLNCPFCIYVTTGFIEKNIIPWWYKLENVLSNYEEIKTPNSSYYLTRRIKEKNSAFLKIRKSIMANYESFTTFNNWLDQLFKHNQNKNDERLFMNWDEIRELSNSKLVTIGVHTDTHPVLSHLDDLTAIKEIKLSREVLQSRINREIRHFAYPFGEYGDFSSRDIHIAKQIGFSSAVTTRNDFLRSENDLFILPRVFYGFGFNLNRTQFKFFIRQIYKNIKKFFKND
jgi:peptidoglycan/xylan/chitin deacetylase (PgdA/CDA1 family)